METKTEDLICSRSSTGEGPHHHPSFSLYKNIKLQICSVESFMPNCLISGLKTVSLGAVLLIKICLLYVHELFPEVYCPQVFIPVLQRTLQLLEGIIYNREELVGIDRLTIMCKEALVGCYQRYYSQSQVSAPSKSLTHIASASDEQLRKDQKTDPEGTRLWNAVQVKLAKVVLILRQLSSHKEILPVSHFSSYLKKVSPATDSPPELAAV